MTSLAKGLAHNEAEGLVVGLSGGLDSTVLLHVAQQFAQSHHAPLRAIHVNHGIQPDAPLWQQHCEQMCQQWQIALDSSQCQLPANASEEQARDARYRVFEQGLRDGEVLLLAQHLDDQLETMLLRLMRGAGPAGLAGMPASRELGKGHLLRPWLAIPRQELLAYASAHSLNWVEDPSNGQTHYDRNFCRLEIMPQLAQRWPDYRDSWQKSQKLLAESAVLLTDLAKLDLQQVQGDSDARLSVPALRKLETPRQRNLLRYWLQEILLVSQPGWQLLQQIVSQLIAATADSEARLDSGNIRLQVFQGQLFALRADSFTAPEPCHWNAIQQDSLCLSGNGALLAQANSGEGLGRVHADNLEVRYRQGGESLRLPGRPTKSLKKLFQELHVPPWYRERTPLLFQEDRLVCVPGIGVHADCKAQPGEEGLLIHWQQPDIEAVAKTSDSP